jgi:hypothetical protein
MVPYCATANRHILQLLSEDEKVILATLEAERAHGSGDKDCLIM